MDIGKLSHKDLGRTVEYEQGVNDGITGYTRFFGTLVQVEHTPHQFILHMISRSGAEVVATGRYGEATIEFV